MKIRKILSSFYYKNFIRINEKTFKVNEELDLHYIFRGGGETEKLIVSFSGFAGIYQRGKYNYIRSLSKSKHCRLFIRDDFGFQKVGSYYLGDNCTVYKHSGVEKLIQQIGNFSDRETVFIGSSKGGTSALFYGILMGANKIVIGSPQYRVGRYLQKNEYHKEILNSIIDEPHGFNVDWLNSMIDYAMDKNQYTGKVIIVYSSKEDGYLEDILPLIRSIKAHGIEIECYDELFQDHSQIGMFFSKYLLDL